MWPRRLARGKIESSWRPTWWKSIPTLHNQTPEPHHIEQASGEYTQWMTPQIGAILLVIGMLALIWLFMAPGFHMGLGFFPWPLLIWGVFFFGRPSRRRRF